jgi:hypothetical protein
MNVARLCVALAALSIFATAQSAQERTFSQSVATVQAALKKAGGSAGTLPVLDGFVNAGSDELDQYERPYYKCIISVVPGKSGGARVRVAAKITAWRNGEKPGYTVLPSNGRLESDLLDRVQRALGAPPGESSNEKSEIKPSSPSESPHDRRKLPAADAPAISAPVAQFPKHFDVNAPSASTKPATDPGLQREADNLSEILRNQSHPTNLVAVKKDQTPVLQNPALDAKVLFLASAEDEFEIIESNPDWIHVRISGLSRGWLRRSLVEFVDDAGAPAVTTSSTSSMLPAAQVASAPADAKTFSIGSEEDSNFPGDWAPLKSKTVKIVSVQTVRSGHNTTAEDKLKFAEEIFQKENLAGPNAAGLVVIFDTEDGGMIAATKTSIEQFRKGAITEQAFWKEAFVDPPEILGSQ